MDFNPSLRYSQPLNAALHYACLGYCVFPCRVGDKQPATKHGCKDATLDEDQISRWWAREPRYNVAISTDGLLVVDADPGSAEWVQGHIDQLVDGPITMTPRGGRHYWFQQNGTALGNTAGTLATGVDTRGNGGYVIVPPSTIGDHAYQWASEIGTELPTAPQWLIDELAEVTQPPLRESNVEQIPVGTRNQVLFRFGSFLRRGGLGADEILASLRAINASRCQPPLTDGELGTIAEQAAKYEPDFIEQARITSHFADAGTATASDEKPKLFIGGVDAYELLLTYEPPKTLRTADEICNPDLASIPLVFGEITLVGGAPASGKTGLLYQLAFDALRYSPDLKLLSVNVEMTFYDLLLRQLSRLAEVPLSDLRSGRIAILDDQLRDARAELHALNPRVAYMTAPFSMPRIVTALEQTGARLLLIDYVQRISVPGFADKRCEMNALIEQLRRVAEQGVAVVCLSSLSRSKQKNGNGYENSTSIGSFRETGEFEFGVENAYVMTAGDEPVCTCELHNLKRRHGQRRNVTLQADFRYQLFTDAPQGIATSLDEFAIGGGWQ